MLLLVRLLLVGAAVALAGSVVVAPQRVLLATVALLCMAMAAGLVSLSHRDGVAALTLMAGLLLLVPENQVLVGPLRSVGNPAQLVGTGCLLLWAAARTLGLVGIQRWHPVRWAAGGFVVAAMTAYVAGQLRPLSVEEGAALNRTVFLVAAGVGILLLSLDAVDDRDRLQTLLARVVWLAGVAAAIGLVEFATGLVYRESVRVPGLVLVTDIAEDTRGDFVRISGAAAHPIEYAVAIAALTPLALHLALSAPGPAVRRRCWLALLAMLAVVPMSVSRAGLLVEVVGLGVYAVHLGLRARLNLLVLGAVGLAAFREAVPGLLGTLRGLFSLGQQDSSIAARTADYAQVPGLMEGHWVAGRGLGTFVPTQYFYLDNEYLGQLLQGGLVGLAAFCLLWAAGVCVARGARHRSGDRGDRGLGQAMAASILGLAVGAVAFDELAFRQTGFLLMLLVGCAGALWTSTRGQPRRRPSGRLRDDAPERPALVGVAP